MARFLAELGWQPPAARAALLAWQSTLDELARLTPIVGEISLDARTGRARALARAHARPPLCRSAACTCCARVDDVGPGYDAVWVTGFTDAAWPEPPHGNPLLPIALQRAHGMPYCVAARRAGALRARAGTSRPAQPRARHQLAGARLRLRDGAEPGDSRLADAVAGRARRVDGGSAAARRRARDGCRRRAAVRRRARAGRDRRARPPGALPVAGVLPGSPRRAGARAARLRRAGAAARHRGASRGRALARRPACASGVSPARADAVAHERRARAREAVRSRARAI